MRRKKETINLNYKVMAYECFKKINEEKEKLNKQHTKKPKKTKTNSNTSLEKQLIIRGQQQLPDSWTLPSIRLDPAQPH